MILEPDELYLENKSFWFKLMARLGIGKAKMFKYIYSKE